MRRLLADGANHRRDQSLPFTAFADLTLRASSFESCRAILAVEKVLSLF
jgi:hypothetical protein